MVGHDQRAHRLSRDSRLPRCSALTVARARSTTTTCSSRPSSRSICLIFRLLHSPFGTALRAMRENETACRTVGRRRHPREGHAAPRQLRHRGRRRQPARPHERLHQPAHVRLVDVGRRLDDGRARRRALAAGRHRRRRRHPPRGRADERPRPVQQHRVRRRPRAVHGVPADRPGRPRRPPRRRDCPRAARLGARIGRRRDLVGIAAGARDRKGSPSGSAGSSPSTRVDLRDRRAARSAASWGPTVPARRRCSTSSAASTASAAVASASAGRDVPTAAPPHSRAAAGLGRTYQTPQIFPDLSVFDNVAIGLAGDAAAVRCATPSSAAAGPARPDAGPAWRRRSASCASPPRSRPLAGVAVVRRAEAPRDRARPRRPAPPCSCSTSRPRA